VKVEHGTVLDNSRRPRVSRTSRTGPRRRRPWSSSLSVRTADRGMALSARPWRLRRYRNTMRRSLPV